MGLLDALFDSSPEGKMAKKLGIEKHQVEEMFAEFDKVIPTNNDEPGITVHA